MEFSLKTKNKVLKILLSLGGTTESFTVEDFQKVHNSITSLSAEDLIQYLHILEFENLIDINFDIDGKVSSILILPDAFSKHAANKSENTYKRITLFFAIISTLCAIIQVIDLLLRV